MLDTINKELFSKLANNAKLMLMSLSKMYPVAKLDTITVLRMRISYKHKIQIIYLVFFYI